jgi:hypothetical protein
MEAKMSEAQKQSLEEKLNRYIKEGKPRLVTYNGKSKHLSNKKLKDLRIKQLEHEGGILPLLALLPAIFGGIAAAGGVAGGAAGIAKAVNDKKAKDAELKEQKHFNQEKLKIMNKAAGEGILQEVGKSPEVIKQFSKTLIKEARKPIKKILNTLTESFEISKQGDGLYLSPKKGSGLYLY